MTLPMLTRADPITAAFPMRPPRRYRFGTTSLLILLLVAGALVSSQFKALLPDDLEIVAEEDPTGVTEENVEQQQELTAIEPDVAATPTTFEIRMPATMVTPPEAAHHVELEQPTESLQAVNNIAIDLAVNESMEDPNPPTDAADTQPAEIDVVAEITANVGAHTDGKLLARLTVLGISDRSRVEHWLRAGMAVLEIRTQHGTFIGSVPRDINGDTFQAFQFNRPSNLNVDPRSDLRVQKDVRLPLPISVIEANLGLAKGIFQISRIDLVFTNVAVTKIIQAQDEIVADLSAGSGHITAEDLHLTFCIDGTDINVSQIKRAGANTILPHRNLCGA